MRHNNKEGFFQETFVEPEKKPPGGCRTSDFSALAVFVCPFPSVRGRVSMRLLLPVPDFWAFGSGFLLSGPGLRGWSEFLSCPGGLCLILSCDVVDSFCVSWRPFWLCQGLPDPAFLRLCLAPLGSGFFLSAGLPVLAIVGRPTILLVFRLALLVGRPTGFLLAR